MTYLGSDKLQTGELPPGLLLDERVDLWVGILQGGVKVLVLHSHQFKIDRPMFRVSAKADARDGGFSTHKVGGDWDRGRHSD